MLVSRDFYSGGHSWGYGKGANQIRPRSASSLDYMQNLSVTRVQSKHEQLNFWSFTQWNCFCHS